KRHTVFSFPEAPTFVRYSGSSQLNSYEERIESLHLFSPRTVAAGLEQKPRRLKVSGVSCFQTLQVRAQNAAGTTNLGGADDLFRGRLVRTHGIPRRLKRDINAEL